MPFTGDPRRRPSPRQGSVQPHGGSSCPSHGGWPHPPMAPWPTILNELTGVHWLPTAIDPRTQPGTGAAIPVALPLSDWRTHTRHTMSWGSRLHAVGSRLWPHAQERSQSVDESRAHPQGSSRSSRGLPKHHPQSTRTSSALPGEWCQFLLRIGGQAPRVAAGRDRSLAAVVEQHSRPRGAIRLRRQCPRTHQAQCGRLDPEGGVAG